MYPLRRTDQIKKKRLEEIAKRKGLGPRQGKGVSPADETLVR